MSFLKDSEEKLEQAKKDSRAPWMRFVNGLKMDGKEKAAVCQLLYAYQERVLRLEQEVWDSNRTLERVLVEREKFYVKLEDV